MMNRKNEKKKMLSGRLYNPSGDDELKKDEKKCLTSKCGYV